NYEGEHFTQSAFTIDWEAKKAVCPQGKISASWSDQRKSSGTPVSRVHFTAQDCAACPAQGKCTKAANGKWGRSLTLLPQDQQAALEERRREQLTGQWQQRYNIRAGVEGTISQAIRRTRIRRTRYTVLVSSAAAAPKNSPPCGLLETAALLRFSGVGSAFVFHRDEGQLGRSVVLQIVQDVLAIGEGEVAGVARPVGDPSGRTVVGVLQAGPVGEGGPEIVEDMPVGMDSFAGGQPDAPYFHFVGLRQQGGADLVVMGVVDELLSKLRAPSVEVLRDEFTCQR
ncbi:transposase, partial [Streptomyces mirabilis]